MAATALRRGALHLFRLLLLILATVSSWLVVSSFSYPYGSQNHYFISTKPMIVLDAAPQRLEENVEGILYVNDRCINCAACSGFAPSIFERGKTKNAHKHIVSKQPTIQNKHELEEARAALSACPVAAIRVEKKVHGGNDTELKRALSIQPAEGDLIFPRPIVNDIDLGVYYLGHHNEGSFGAIPYLALGKSPDGSDISVVVDVPKFCPSAVRAVKSLTPSGPDYLFLTHVDDTAHHNKWLEEFPNMKRIFHAGDLGRHNWIGDQTLENVEILLQEKIDDGKEEFVVWDINGNEMDNEMQSVQLGDFIILHTPGHSPGSISLLFQPKQPKADHLLKHPGVLFTGDTFAWTTRDGGHMSGFPRYGYDLHMQAETIQKLGKLSHMWNVVAPGHGHVRSYLDFKEEDASEMKSDDIKAAVSELLSY